MARDRNDVRTTLWLRSEWPSFAVIGLVVAACAAGPSGNESTSTEAPAATVAEVATTTTTVGPPPDVDIALVASEHRDDPARTGGFAFFGDDVTAETPTLTVQAGQPVTIWLLNSHGQYSASATSHDFAVIPRLDDIQTLVGSQLEDEILWESRLPKVFGGESATVSFVPETPGEYLFVCTLPGHVAAGMVGDFVVTG